MINREIERHNMEAIRKLNQRGGRTLSVVDLYEDGTLDRKLIDFFLQAIWSGDSLLAAAGPSGTGKTTLMGALLNLIPPGTRIRTAEKGRPLPDGEDQPLFMAHELNDAPYYGYIWDGDARQFLEAAGENQIAATLHAESLKGVRKKLTRHPVGLSREDFEEIELVATMKKNRRGGETLRRIDGIYEKSGEEHRQLFRWEQEEDEYLGLGPAAHAEAREEETEKLDRKEFLEELLKNKPKRLEEVRELLLEFVSN